MNFKVGNIVIRTLHDALYGNIGHKAKVIRIKSSNAIDVQWLHNNEVETLSPYRFILAKREVKNKPCIK